ncbi:MULTISPECIES: hypothetical protein [unclassified Nonomuraea]|uniref:hypothetical protein n=1 Tax=unclassified Nonomuraea TaxID=2593643 RepID=UPI0033E854EA
MSIRPRSIAHPRARRIIASTASAYAARNRGSAPAALYRKLGRQEAGDLPTDFYPQLKLSVFALARG